MKNLFLIPLVLVAFVASGCENIQNSGTKEKIGGVSGAVVGGLLGSKVGGGSGHLSAVTHRG